jgi:hypothetical protein
VKPRTISTAVTTVRRSKSAIAEPITPSGLM